MPAAEPVRTANAQWWEPRIERAALKALMKRADGPGLYFLGVWAVLLVAAGVGIHFARGTGWIVPAVVVYGLVLGFADGRRAVLLRADGLGEKSVPGTAAVDRDT
ncbi:MAG TPA: hypothetical protein PKC20_16670, partial [Burkholderiaceae bacterium]|nr:hypothetical protein [Burkholderiaceae bacterium]